MNQEKTGAFIAQRPSSAIRLCTLFKDALKPSVFSIWWILEAPYISLLSLKILLIVIFNFSFSISLSDLVLLRDL